MKTNAFILFFSIVFVIYFLLNLYLYLHGLHSLPEKKNIRLIYSILFAFLFVSYIISKFLERTEMFEIARVFSWIGSFWLGAIFYFFLFILLLDLLRLFNHWIHFLPSFLYIDYQKTKFYTGLFSTLFIFMLLLAGFINELNPRVKRIQLDIHKKSADIKKLKVVMVSDIHLGALMGQRRVEAMVNRINSLNPDLVLFAGDILDEVISPVIYHDTGKPLLKLSAPLGVYAITGNHEYIGGIEKAVKYIEAHHIKLLRDSCIEIAQSFYLAGREDRDKKRFTGTKRKSLQDILEGIDHTLPVILMDHQPFNLDETINNKVDLQLSGHTHHGQIWPINYLTKRIFEISWGYQQKGQTHFYVSNGYGTWGPPIRLGSRPEIVCLEIRFEQ